MTRSCDPMALAFFGHTHQVAFESWPTFSEVMELHCYLHPRTRVPNEPRLAFDTHLDGPSPHSVTYKHDNNLPIDEEGEEMCGRDDTTYCLAGKLHTECLQGLPPMSSRILAPR